MALVLLWCAMEIALASETPEERAIRFLVREVPRWSRENHCFSCHNNGDGARVLYVATRRKYRVPADALTDTTEWLLVPREWGEKRVNPAFSDKKLATIQFAAALSEACKAGVAGVWAALMAAGESLVAYQEPDGAWRVDTGASAGSPITYGTGVATYLAKEALATAAPERFAGAIARADSWLARSRPQSTPDVAAVLLGAGNPKWLEVLLAAQSGDGGWGPQPHAPSQVFDTALALIALAPHNGQLRARAAIARGRAFLVTQQQESGAWPETTRPPGGQSYAQQISTCAWAAMALLQTRTPE